MPHKIIFSNAPQGSDEWLEDRIGKLTGSVAAPIFVEPSKKALENGDLWGEGAKTLAREICAERLTQRSIEGTLCAVRDDQGNVIDFKRNNFETGAMAWGKYFENESRALINEKHNLSFEEIGFARIEDKMAGCSLDGFCFQDGKRIGLEMKHYETKKALELIENPESFWLDEKKLTKEALQCIFNAWVMQLDEIYLVCRDPRLPSPLDNHFIEIVKNGDELKKLVEECENKALKFLEYVDNMYKKYENVSLNILGLD